MINQDFRDLLRALCEAEARFLIVGAYALAVHGLPRATGDIDIWVEATPTNAQKVMRALAAFGAPLQNLSENDLSSPGIVFQIGLPPRRIDILTRISGVEFSYAWKNKKTASFNGIECFVLSVDDMMINKKATGRPKDLVDLETLQIFKAAKTKEEEG